MKKGAFKNAKQMAESYPDTFNRPDTHALDNLKAEDWVKVCASDAERFWVILTERNGDQLVGMIDNELVRTHEHGYMFMDFINFNIDNVYSIIKKGESFS